MRKEKGQKPHRSKGKSLFRRINDWLHLWLGLASGIVIVIVAITGCIYVFEREIRSVTEPWQFVKAEDRPMLPPSVLKQKAEQFAFGGKTDTLQKRILGVTYNAPGFAAISAYNIKETGYSMLYQNPYTGEVLKEKRLNKDFFRFILQGHYYLWLPDKIGHPIVGWAVFIFLIILISGLIMWWPKNLKKANVDKSFKIKWGASFKRVNYDLHNVLGFYVMLVAFAIAVTGSVWSFEWFRKAYYFTISGGQSLYLGNEKTPQIDIASLNKAAPVQPEDALWYNMMAKYPNNKGAIQIQFRAKAAEPIGVMYNPQEKTYYKREFHKYNPATLEEIKLKGTYARSYDEGSFADKIYRMNYDIHVGAIGGITGKIIAFFASLVCATLPVTGFIIWLGKKKKKKKPAAAKHYAETARKKDVISVTV